MLLDVFLVVCAIVGQGQVATCGKVARRLHTSPQVAWRNMDELIARGIVKKISHGKYDLNKRNPYLKDIQNFMNVDEDRSK